MGFPGFQTIMKIQPIYESYKNNQKSAENNLEVFKSLGFKGYEDPPEVVELKGFRHDGIRVARAVCVDVCNGAANSIHYAHHANEVEEFRVPIRRCGGSDALAENFRTRFIHAQLYSLGA